VLKINTTDIQTFITWVWEEVRRRLG